FCNRLHDQHPDLGLHESWKPIWTPLFRGPDWTPITPKRGFFLHAYSQIPDVGADHLLVPPDGRDEVPPRPEWVTQKIPRLALHILLNPDRTSNSFLSDTAGLI